MHYEPALIQLIGAIASGDRNVTDEALRDSPDLATSRLARADEQLLDVRRAQVYEGDTALHAAAFSYDVEVARALVRLGADVRARNRRGAEPLHSATSGGPGALLWDPAHQCAVIGYLIGAGADPNATATGGVTPLHRAVRNRCSAAVVALLKYGADASPANDSGSTAYDLAQVTSGRGGTGTAEARAEQQVILDALRNA